jgi:hypothetical protein
MTRSVLPTIVVDLSLTRVTFSQADDLPVSFVPTIHVSADGKILAVGGEPTSGMVAHRIEVFSEDPPPLGVSKLDCLTALFRHGLKTLFDRSLFRLRPQVMVHGVGVVGHMFGGYERDLIALALMRAGAKAVVWLEHTSIE